MKTPAEDADYNWYHLTNQHKLFEQVPLGDIKRLEFVKEYLSGTILDVGCGQGLDVNYFANFDIIIWDETITEYKKGHYNIEGCDISTEAIKKAKHLFPKNNYFVHNFFKRPTKKKYATIYSFDVLEHVYDFKPWLKNVMASLDLNGCLILGLPNPMGLKNRLKYLFGDSSVIIDRAHVTHLDADALTNLLEESGGRGVTFMKGHFPVNWRGSLTVACMR